MLTKSRGGAVATVVADPGEEIQMLPTRAWPPWIAGGFIVSCSANRTEELHLSPHDTVLRIRKCRVLKIGSK